MIFLNFKYCARVKVIRTKFIIIHRPRYKNKSNDKYLYTQWHLKKTNIFKIFIKKAYRIIIVKFTDII